MSAAEQNSAITRAYEELLQIYEKSSCVGFPAPLSRQQLSQARRALFQRCFDEQAAQRRVRGLTAEAATRQLQLQQVEEKLKITELRLRDSEKQNQRLHEQLADAE